MREPILMFITKESIFVHDNGRPLRIGCERVRGPIGHKDPIAWPVCAALSEAFPLPHRLARIPRPPLRDCQAVTFHSTNSCGWCESFGVSLWSRLALVPW